MEFLIKKLANSFANTTGLDYEDLFQEAQLAYLEALRTYDKDRGAVSTHVWWCVSNRLKNYIKKENEERVCSIPAEEYDVPISSTPFWEKLSKDATRIADIVLDSPQTFLKLGKTHSPKKIKEIMMNEGWDKKKIQRSISELQTVFS
jgi:DNA-directed RNA polymerase specialized sigma24 family protein